MIVIIIETNKYLRRINLDDDTDETTEEVLCEYSPVRYDCIDLEQALNWYVYECNEGYSEFNFISFKVHQILVYHNEFPNETPYLLTDMTPCEKYFKQIKCYDWSESQLGDI